MSFAQEEIRLPEHVEEAPSEGTGARAAGYFLNGLSVACYGMMVGGIIMWAKEPPNQKCGTSLANAQDLTLIGGLAGITCNVTGIVLLVKGIRQRTAYQAWLRHHWPVIGDVRRTSYIPPTPV
jgi:hypothetical protein